MEDSKADVPNPPDRLFIREVTNHAEALYNLIYLICEEADHPAKVRHYASLSEHSLQALTQLLREQL
ncbi:hypothetical protein [Granulicella sp. S190]|uniref:hypothetical protein n=1 Tax=Granulicella sp. S190 TaxID=1747226 RepID=UPI00131EAC70|nr:hypothetical protein [Granulicella sp. S190]